MKTKKQVVYPMEFSTTKPVKDTIFEEAIDHHANDIIFIKTPDRLAQTMIELKDEGVCITHNVVFMAMGGVDSNGNYGIEVASINDTSSYCNFLMEEGYQTAILQLRVLSDVSSNTMVVSVSNLPPAVRHYLANSEYTYQCVLTKVATENSHAGEYKATHFITHYVKQ